MKNKKAAIGLSMNFIVVIIIAVVIFGVGIAIVTQYVDFAEEEQKLITEQQQQQIENLLKQGRKVIIPSNTQTIPRGEAHVFGLGILNMNPAYSEFIIEIGCSKSMTKAGVQDPQCPGLKPEAFLFNTDKIKIDNNQDHTESIFVKVPKQGVTNEQYIFNVNVSAYDSTSTKIQYGNTQKIIINIP